MRESTDTKTKSTEYIEPSEHIDEEEKGVNVKHV
jgi:hypothetical protein